MHLVKIVWGKKYKNIKIHLIDFIQSEESRPLTQIQYMAWPDHGVPDDYTDFLDFVSLVRRKREGKEEPVIVHCR